MPVTSYKPETVEALADGDLVIDRARSGSTLLAARSQRGQLFLRRTHGNFWNGRMAFFNNPHHAQDIILVARAMGLDVREAAQIIYGKSVDA